MATGRAARRAGMTIHLRKLEAAGFLAITKELQVAQRVDEERRHDQHVRGGGIGLEPPPPCQPARGPAPPAF